MAFTFETPVDGVGAVIAPAAGNTINVYAVGSPDDYLLIDCGTDRIAPRIIKTLVEAGYRPGCGRAVIPTHGHADHFGGAAKLSAWAEAPVWAHPSTAVQVEDHWGQFVARGDIGIDESVNAWKGFKEWAGEEVAVSKMLRDGDALDIPGGGEFRVLHCPGHERGLIVLHDAERGLGFCGDLVQGGYNASNNWLALIPDPERQRESLKRFLDLDLKWLFKGHRLPESGEAVARDIKAALARVEKIRESVLESLGEKSPDTLAELTRKAFVKVLDNPREDSPSYALMTVGGFLAMLQREGKVSRNVDLTWELAD